MEDQFDNLSQLGRRERRDVFLTFFVKTAAATDSNVVPQEALDTLELVLDAAHLPSAECFFRATQEYLDQRAKREAESAGNVRKREDPPPPAFEPTPAFTEPLLESGIDNGCPQLPDLADDEDLLVSTYA